MLLLGIDPGISGGMGLLGHDGRYLESWLIQSCIRRYRTLKSGKLSPQRELDARWMFLTIKSALILNGVIIGQVIAEEQVAFPDQHANTGLSMGDTRGVIRGVCAALGISVSYVKPSEWKKFYGLKGAKGRKYASKEESLALARSFYPDAPLASHKDEAVAEALLIARWHQTVGEKGVKAPWGDVAVAKRA